LRDRLGSADGMWTVYQRGDAAAVRDILEAGFVD
jgi:hypothetical protein